MEEEVEEAEEVLGEEEVGHKNPMATGSEDEKAVEVLGCLSVTEGDWILLICVTGAA